MKCTNLAYAMVAAVITAVAPATPARAALFDTYLSANGSDTNPCTLTAPCVTMSRAVGQTIANGVLHCLDGGDFSGATLTQNITIDCSNTTAAAGSFSINTAGITVHIKGLTMFALGSTAISFTLGKALIVENCDIFGNAQGIVFQPTANAKLSVIGGIIHDNTTASGILAGIYIKPASGVTANVSIERNHIENNLFGIIADGSAGGIVRGLISDSFVTGNNNNGITVSTAASNVVFTVDNTKVSGNAFGLVASGSGAGMLVRRSIVTTNNTGLSASGGALLSYRDNTVNANTSDGAFTGFVGTQ